jgi:hypothetical protein
VEATGNTRLFYDAAVKDGARVVVVSPSQFKGISQMPITFYRRIQRRRGGEKTNIALARKFLGVIYHTLKNIWVFEGFPNFVMAS